MSFTLDQPWLRVPIRFGPVSSICDLVSRYLLKERAEPQHSTDGHRRRTLGLGRARRRASPWSVTARQANGHDTDWDGDLLQRLNSPTVRASLTGNPSTVYQRMPCLTSEHLFYIIKSTCGMPFQRSRSLEFAPCRYRADLHLIQILWTGNPTAPERVAWGHACATCSHARRADHASRSRSAPSSSHIYDAQLVCVAAPPRRSPEIYLHAAWHRRHSGCIRKPCSTH